MIEDIHNAFSNRFQEVYVDGKAFRFENKETISIAFHGQFYRFEQFKEVIKDDMSDYFISIVPDTEKDKSDMSLTHHYNSSIVNDGFQLRINDKREIEVETGSLRGFRYAIEALTLLIQKKDSAIICPIAEINHTPSFSMRGVIEGFYGVPWTNDDRIDLLRFLGENQMNTYMYAPKDDELQRKRWREKYPDEKLEEFKNLLAISEEEKIDFYYMISPGNDIDYTKPSEVEVLTDKLQQLIDSGVRHFGLLMDDIDYQLKGNAKIRFASAASAHGFLIKQVDDFLKTTLEDYTLVVCPTEYDNANGSAYLNELTEKVSPEIPFFWTGPSTLARRITTKDIERMADVYKRPMVIWDNVPVNDFEKDYERIFLSPYENRSQRLADPRYQVVGVVSNPMAQWELSKLTVHNMGLFLWDAGSFDTHLSWIETVKALGGEDYLDALLIFAHFNPNRHSRETYTEFYLEKLRAHDHSFIDEQLSQLKDAVDVLKNHPHSGFQKQVGPWFKRVEMDLDLWEKVKLGEQAKIKETVEKLKEHPYRIGIDLPAKYIDMHHLLV